MALPLSLLVLTCIFAFYMAWAIGANDVANAMGAAVGSGALTLGAAILIAGAAEFLGAVLVGEHVTSTIHRGIVNPVLFRADPLEFMMGMSAALLGAAFWLHAATILGLPVSTTHSIVGAVVGFGLVARGVGGLYLWNLFKIVMSWFVSPLAGGLLSYWIYVFIRDRILAVRDQDEATRRYAPFILFVVVVVLLQSFVFKGMKNLKLPVTFWSVLLLGVVLGGVIAAGTRAWLGKAGPRGRELTNRFFGFLMVATAGYVAFAHGANDVGNAVGPLAAVLDIYHTGTVPTANVTVPWWVLGLGGVGIVAGLAVYGKKVIATIGGKITEINPQNGFAAQFGTAVTVLVCSQMGLPISTSHTVVGAVIGVGMARGVGALNLGVIRNIVYAWVVTLPFAAGATMIVFRVLEYFFR
jgi:PiT family inorganic phosphate transporter